MALIGLMGAGVDTARWNQARSRMILSLDSAVLAGARQLQLGDDPAQALASAKAYFYEEVRGRVTVRDEDLTFMVLVEGGGIEGSVKANLATTLLGVFGVESLPITATSRVEFSTGGASGTTELEVALMLDVTGSMCADGVGPCQSSAKLDALKKGAADLVSIIIKDSPDAPRARVALVPFSTRVRVGNYDAQQPLMKLLTNLDPKSSAYIQECTSWSGSGDSETSGNWTCYSSRKVYYQDRKVFPCVSDRTGPAEYTDDAPGPGRWLVGHDGTRRLRSWDSSETKLSSSTGSKSDPTYDWNYATWGEVGWCADIGRANEIMPLSSNRDALIKRLQGLEAYGSTAGALGTAWAWYMLSENWGNIWTGDSKPGAYADTAKSASGDAKLRKVAILMSDGVYNTYRSWKDYDKAEVSNRAKKLCEGMKAKGIEIFTVAFDLDSLPANDRARARDTLKSCGTDVSHFYETLDTEQLRQAFRGIALQMSRLYIAH